MDIISLYTKVILGFVTYQSDTEAEASGLASTKNGQIYLGVDHSSKTSTGRASVRVSSNDVYNGGLFIADIPHVPERVCGSWPAFWTLGPNWPSFGEIDIIEGVNLQTTNRMTLHTDPGCSISGSNCNEGAGKEGCHQDSSSMPFGKGGGIYAMEWTSSAIKFFYFPSGSSDIDSNAPDPSSWSPAATFPAGPGCSIADNFKNHQIVFDTTFCGEWAGGIW